MVPEKADLNIPFGRKKMGAGEKKPEKDMGLPPVT